MTKTVLIIGISVIGAYLEFGAWCLEFSSRSEDFSLVFVYVSDFSHKLHKVFSFSLQFYSVYKFFLLKNVFSYVRRCYRKTFCLAKSFAGYRFLHRAHKFNKVCYLDTDFSTKTDYYVSERIYLNLCAR